MYVIWVLFLVLFFIASLFDLKYKKIPSIIVAPNLLMFGIISYLENTIYAVKFLVVFSMFWFFIVLLKYLTEKVALNFIDILYLSLSMVLVKRILLFLIVFTFLSYVFWLKNGKKEVPLLPPLFFSFFISI